MGRRHILRGTTQIAGEKPTAQTPHPTIRFPSNGGHPATLTERFGWQLKDDEAAFRSALHHPAALFGGVFAAIVPVNAFVVVL